MTTPLWNTLFTPLVLLSPVGPFLPCIPASFSLPSTRPSSPSCPLNTGPMPSCLFILYILTEQLTPLSSVKLHILMTPESSFLAQAALLSFTPINWLVRHLYLDNLEASHPNLRRNPSSFLSYYIFSLMNGTTICRLPNQIPGKNPCCSCLRWDAFLICVLLCPHLHLPWLILHQSKILLSVILTFCLVILIHSTYHNQNYLLKYKSNFQTCSWHFGTWSYTIWPDHLSAFSLATSLLDAD